MGGKHVTFCTLTILMSTLALFLLPLPLPPLSPSSCLSFLHLPSPSQQASVQMWASPTCNQWLQNKTICSKMYSALFLRSPGLQVVAPPDFPEPVLPGDRVFSCLCPTGGCPCLRPDSALPAGLRTAAPGLQGAGDQAHRDFCRPFEP